MFKEHREDFLPLGAIFTLSFFLGLQYYLNTNVLVDDQFIFEPILNFLVGKKNLPLHYPDFPYLFYGSIYVFLSSIFKAVQIEPLNHFINLILFSLNGCLFYLVSKPFLKREWRFFGSLLFIFSPAVFFSAIAVKTEGLLLFQIFLGIHLAQNFINNPKNLKTVVLSGIVAGISFTTKYNPLFLVFLSTLCIHFDFSLKKLIKSKILWCFCGVFVLTVLVTWPSFWQFMGPFNSKLHLNDDYFSPFPNPFKASSEWFSFPHGRYSSAFVSVLPYAIGVVTYLSFLGAVFTRIINKNAWIIWGVFTAAYLLLVLNVTLTRYYYLFTPAAPFIILGAAMFWQLLSEKINPPLKKAIVILPILLGLIQYPMYADISYGYSGVLNYLGNEIVPTLNPRNKNDLWPLILSHKENNYDWKNLDLAIKKENPKYLFVLDSLLLNYCKYRDKNYTRQCEYFKKLLNSDEGYEIKWVKSIDFPLKSLVFDQEKSMTFFLLKRLL